MGKKYQKKTRRSRRKVQDLDPNAVRVEMGDGQAVFQLMLPMNELLVEVAGAIEATASQAGLLMMKAMIDEEVEQLVGPRYAHDASRQAVRWGNQEGHVIYAGRKVAMARPRVRGKDGQEKVLRRYQAFQSPRRMQQTVQERVLRRVATRDYEGGS